MYLLGLDVGSSSVKASLIEAATGKTIVLAISSQKEMQINAPRPGWAEQTPQEWWDNVKIATHKILTNSSINPFDIKAIGISYQMHGLVLVDTKKQVLRPAIIWCDSRAVAIGQKAFEQLGVGYCLKNLLNSPGNFTASKLRWVIENEPKVYSKIHKIMMPGDFIAMKITGEIKTTPCGLSEGIMWDFVKGRLAESLLEYYGIDRNLIAEVVPTFSIQGQLTKQAADELGLKKGTVVSYRAGDQPNNALSLNVLEPGEIAATAGTSGVICGITDKGNYDSKSRVNSFVHVNHCQDKPRYAVLLCLNGTGILNSWLKHNFTMVNNSGILDYDQMNALAAEAPAGSAGLFIYPYGNGAERTLENRNIGASFEGLNFNIHKKEHILRAAQEGIIFALNYGLEIMRNMGIELKTARVGFANMFLSPLFAQVFSTVTGINVELYKTDGSVGAAIGAGIGMGVYKNHKEAFAEFRPIKILEPDENLTEQYKEIYKKWEEILNKKLLN